MIPGTQTSKDTQPKSQRRGDQRKVGKGKAGAEEGRRERKWRRAGKSQEGRREEEREEFREGGWI